MQLRTYKDLALRPLGKEKKKSTGLRRTRHAVTTKARGVALGALQTVLRQLQLQGTRYAIYHWTFRNRAVPTLPLLNMRQRSEVPATHLFTCPLLRLLLMINYGRA